MTSWVNRVVIAAPRNGTTSHTVDPSAGTVVAGALFTPTAGRVLVVVAYGAVTSTTPSGWVLDASAVNSGGIYVWRKDSAAGADTFTTTHNGSNYPVVFDVMEFAAGSTYNNDVTAINLAASSANPSLAGFVNVYEGAANGYAARGGNDSTSGQAVSGVWSGATETVDVNTEFATTSGYWFTAAAAEPYAATDAFAPSNVRSGTADNAEGVTFALTALEFVPPTLGPAFSSSAFSSAAFYTPAPSGPVDYPRDVGDTAAAVDTIARSSTRSRAVGDTAAAGDSTVATVTRARAVADSAPAADSVARGAAARTRTVADTAAAVDTVARAGGRARAVADSAPAADATSGATTRNLARDVADSAPASDAVARGAAARARATTDTAPAVDVVTRAGTRPRAISETAQAVDVVTRSAAARTRAVADAAPAVDNTSASTTGNLSRNVTDSAPAVDTVARGAAARARTVTDAAPAADVVARAPLALTRSRTEAAPATDTTSASSTGNQSRSIPDTAPATDAVGRRTTAARTAGDAAPAADQVARRVARPRSLGEAAPASEIVARALTVARQLLDQALAVDDTVGVYRPPGRDVTIVDLAAHAPRAVVVQPRPRVETIRQLDPDPPTPVQRPARAVTIEEHP